MLTRFPFMVTVRVETQPRLIVFSGLPGMGKTTIARALAARSKAAFVRIDVIEHALRSSGVQQGGSAGYAVANALAESNLRLGQSVIADCVNSVRESRMGWQAVAKRSLAKLVDIHVVCTDLTEHRRRIENRTSDIVGHLLPTWDEVGRHEFEERDDDYAQIDTAVMTAAEAVYLCESYIPGERGNRR